jgi:hypothetical protein
LPDRPHLSPRPVTDPATAAPAAPVPRSGGAANRFDPARVLMLQRTAGNAAVGRLLARAPQPPATADPFDLSAEELDQLLEAGRAERAQQVAEVRTRVLTPLEAGDALGFLSALRTLDAAERSRLRTDDGFWTEIRRRFRGMALWVVQLTIEYGSRKPDEVNAVSAAIHSRDWQRTRNLIMAYPSLQSVVGIRQAIASQFEGSQNEDLQRALQEQHGVRAEAAGIGGKRVHYEDGALEKYTGAGAFELVRMNSHVRVIVRIKLYNDRNNERNVISNESIQRWEEGINRYWNGKFRLRNGARALDVYFLPVFVFYDDSAHHDVRVLPGDERSARLRWYADDSADTAAHEFGHMIGNPDEYGLPGTMAEIPAALGLTDAEKRRSSWEGIFGRAKPVDEEGYEVKGLMGDHEKHRSVEVRHAFWVLQVFNDRLRRPGEEPWTVEKR